MRTSNLNFHSNNSKLLGIWEITFFSSISAILGFFLLSKGWEPIYKTQIHIEGIIHTSREQVIEAMEINLPISILEINPKKLERNLLKKLPIKAVAINRRIAPLGLARARPTRARPKPFFFLMVLKFDIQKNNNSTHKY